MGKNKLVLSFCFTVLLSLLALNILFGGEPIVVSNTGQAYRWNISTGPVGYSTDGGTLGLLDNAAANTFIANSFQGWENVGTASISFTNVGQIVDAFGTPIDVDETNFGQFFPESTNNGQNEIIYDTNGAITDALFGPNSGVLGFAGPNWITTTAPFYILGGRAVINGAPVDGDPANGERTIEDLLATVVHEIGHFLNLAHSQVNGNAFLAGENIQGFGTPPVSSVETMYPFAFTNDTTAVSLELDDISMLTFLYPDTTGGLNKTSLQNTGEITGKIFFSDNITAATGVNVIARNASGGAATIFKDAVSQISGAFFEATNGGTNDVDLDGRYTLYQLTAGANYSVEIDEIGGGGFSTTTLIPLPAPEEFYNGASESADSTADDPSDIELVVAIANQVVTGIDIIMNEVPQKLTLSRYDGAIEFVSNVRSLAGASGSPNGANDFAAVSFSIPASVDTPFTVSLGSFLNNDDLTIWPRVLLTTANSSGQPDLSNPLAEATNVPGDAVQVFKDVPFGVRRTNFEDVFFVIQFPPGEVLTSGGSGGGAALGIDTSLDLGFIPGNLFSVDGVNFQQANSGVEGRTRNWAITLEITSEFTGPDKLEPNDDVASATNISYGDTRRASIDPKGELDYYTFSGSAGDTIQANVAAKTHGSSLDGYLVLLNSNGDTVAVHDDENPGVAQDPNLQFVLPADDNYVIVIDSWDNAQNSTPVGGIDFYYELELDTFSPQLEPNNDTSEATAIDTAQTIDAGLDVKGDIDFFSFAGLADYFVKAQLTPGTPVLNPVLTLFDTDGTTVLETQNAATLRTQLPGDGTYYIAVADLQGRGGSEFSYSLIITIAEPSLPAPINLSATGSKDKVVLSWEPPASGSMPLLSFTSNPVDEVEPNNRVDTAQELKGPSPVVVNGSAEVSDAGQLGVNYTSGDTDDFEDLFLVEITSPGLKIDLNNFTSDLDLFLLDNPPTAFMGVSNGSSDELINLPTLAVGSYIIGVTIVDFAPGGSTTSAYTLTVAGDIPADVSVLSYNIYRSETPVAFISGKSVGNVDASVTTFTDETLAANTYFYQVTANYTEGESEPSNEVSAIVTSVHRNNSNLPASYALNQNYPNPFNPSTVIKYALPASHGNRNVTVNIFNMVGQKVRTLVNAEQTAKYYEIEWDGKNDIGKRVTSGLYLYRIKAGSFFQTKKMLLIK